MLKNGKRRTSSALFEPLAQEARIILNNPGGKNKRQPVTPLPSDNGNNEDAYNQGMQTDDSFANRPPKKLFRNGQRTVFQNSQNIKRLPELAKKGPDSIPALANKPYGAR